jgi:hypothetical protein
MADGLARNLIEQSDEAVAKLECESDGIVVGYLAQLATSWGSRRDDSAAILEEVGRYSKLLRCTGRARGDASDQICMVLVACCVVVLLYWV